MSEKDQLQTPRSVKSIWPAVVLLAVAVGIFVVAQGYSEISRRFPTMVSATLAVLAAIDLYSRTNLPGRDSINAFWGSGFDRREMTHDPALRDELALVGWILLAFVGIASLGILVAVPLFCLLYMRLRSGRPLWQAAAVGCAVLVFEYTVFEWVLDYELYRGLIFSEEGLSAW